MDQDNQTTQPDSDPLTDREQQILDLLAKGFSDRAIAESIFLSIGTVKWYNRQIYSKLHVSSRTEAIAQAQRLGLLPTSNQPSIKAIVPSVKHNLPAQVTSFIGRAAERAEIQHFLNDTDTRFVTLTGPPGTGKTRLAQTIATDLLDSLDDGAAFVSLAPIADPAVVINNIAQVLGIGEQGTESMLDAVKRYLANRSILLVLDNFEHLLDAAPLVSDLLMAAPRLKVLATSREPLHLYGEHEYPVSPLQLPDLKQRINADLINTCEAVELFVQRAKAVLPTFQLTDNNAESVAAICTHVDGLPLAIELAAAHVKFYAPQSLLMRLGSRLDALSDGPRDLPARQRALRATLAWSYGLLASDEKTLFARLGIFAGGCTLDDVRIICADNMVRSISAGLESLVNKSLVQTQNNAQETRFTLLETMREYALEQLEASGQKSFFCDQHAQHFLALAETATSKLYGSITEIWFHRLETEHDNLRAALRWFLQVGKGQLALQLIGRLSRFWKLRGYMNEGRAWFAQARKLETAQRHTSALAHALQSVGDLAYMQSDYEAAQSLYTEALSIYSELNDQRGVAHTLVGLGEVATEVGHYDIAPALFEQAYTIMYELGDMPGCAKARTQLGWGALRIGNLDEAQKWLEEGLSLYQTVDDTVAIALTYSGLGETALRKGQFVNAKTWLEKSLAIRRTVGQIWGTAASLGTLAWVALKQGNHQEATNILEESLLMRQELGDKGGIAWCLEKMAEIAIELNDISRAVRILGAAAIIRGNVKSVVDPVDQVFYQQMIDDLRAKLGSSVFAAAWSEGQSMNTDQVIRYVFPNGF